MLGLLFDSEDGNSRFLKTIGNDLLDFMGPDPGTVMMTQNLTSVFSVANVPHLWRLARMGQHPASLPIP
jgi:hypothetical protein